MQHRAARLFEVAIKTFELNKVEFGFFFGGLTMWPVKLNAWHWAVAVLAIGGMSTLEAEACCHRACASRGGCTSHSVCAVKSQCSIQRVPTQDVSCCIASPPRCGVCHYGCPPTRRCGEISIQVCCKDAKVFIQGKGTASQGEFRSYHCEGLVPGKNCCIEVKVVCDGREQLSRQVCLQDGIARLKCSDAHKQAKKSSEGAKLGADDQLKDIVIQLRGITDSFGKLNSEVNELTGKVQQYEASRRGEATPEPAPAEPVNGRDSTETAPPGGTVEPSNDK